MGFSDPRDTARWAARTMSRLRPQIAAELGVQIRAPLKGACGAHGCVFDTDRKVLLGKLTEDADEAAAAQHFAPLQRSGWLRDVVRIRSVRRVPADRPTWLILRERVRPADLSPPQASILYESTMELVRAEEAGRTPLNPEAMALWPVLVSDPQLLAVARLRLEMRQLGLVALDLFANNLGRRSFSMKGWPRPPSLVLLDTGGIVSTGGIPLSVERIRPLRAGAANRGRGGTGRGHPAPSCPGQDKLEAEFKRLLGRDEGGRHCEIVPDKTLHKVARNHGWKTPQGVVGFHTPGDKIYISANNTWSVSHELAHRYGLTDDHLARWVSEALTEFVAEEAAKQTGEPHERTYGYERSVVLEHLCPGTGKTPLELAKISALSERPDRAITELLQRGGKWKSVPRGQLLRALGPGSRGDEPELFLNLASNAAR